MQDIALSFACKLSIMNSNLQVCRVYLTFLVWTTLKLRQRQWDWQEMYTTCQTQPAVVGDWEGRVWKPHWEGVVRVDQRWWVDRRSASIPKIHKRTRIRGSVKNGERASDPSPNDVPRAVMAAKVPLPPPTGTAGGVAAGPGVAGVDGVAGVEGVGGWEALFCCCCWVLAPFVLAVAWDAIPAQKTTYQLVIRETEDIQLDESTGAEQWLIIGKFKKKFAKV